MKFEETTRGELPPAERALELAVKLAALRASAEGADKATILSGVARGLVEVAAALGVPQASLVEVVRVFAAHWDGAHG